MPRYFALRPFEPVEAAAFVAALSRVLAGPLGSVEPGAPVRYRRADGLVWLYLSPAALVAAETTFSPVPVESEALAELIPHMRPVFPDSAVPAWGLDEAIRALAG